MLEHHLHPHDSVVGRSDDERPHEPIADQLGEGRLFGNINTDHFPKDAMCASFCADKGPANGTQRSCFSSRVSPSPPATRRAVRSGVNVSWSIHSSTTPSSGVTYAIFSIRVSTPSNCESR